MSKPGNKNNKQRCEKYKAENRRAINKQKKAEKHKKKMQKFADRKAAGKSYVYDKKHAEEKRNAGIPIGSNINSKKHTDIAKWDSVWAKLNNEKQKKMMALRRAKNSAKEE